MVNDGQYEKKVSWSSLEMNQRHNKKAQYNWDVLIQILFDTIIIIYIWIILTLLIPLRADLGLELARFTQLKRCTRFDDFIMLVWGQGWIFQMAAGSLPVQEACGSQNSLYRGQIQKFLQSCKNHQIPRYNDSEKV